MPPANDLILSHAKSESILQQIKDDPRESFHIYIYTYLHNITQRFHYSHKMKTPHHFTQ